MCIYARVNRMKSEKKQLQDLHTIIKERTKVALPLSSSICERNIWIDICSASSASNNACWAKIDNRHFFLKNCQDAHINKLLIIPHGICTYKRKHNFTPSGASARGLTTAPRGKCQLESNDWEFGIAWVIFGARTLCDNSRGISQDNLLVLHHY